MSNHFSAARLKSPGDDPRLDLTDLYVFPSASPGRTVVMVNVNPFMGDSAFHPDAVYRVNIDSDGDIQPDAAFTFTFSEPPGGGQACTARYAAGPAAREPEPRGDVLTEGTPVSFGEEVRPVQAGAVRLFAGKRSDPFFADAEGPMHGFEWTGVDTFAGKNVMSIAIESPDEMLGPDAAIGVWATSSVHRDGTLVQMDRGANPTINPFLNPDDAKDEYNSRQPSGDVANYLGAWSELLVSYGYPPDQARAAALTVLPDVLHYDRTAPATYPNGRLLTDDVFSERFAWLTNGNVGPDGLSPHDDLTAQFPYLGPPNP
jgi:hypothetical protein